MCTSDVSPSSRIGTGTSIGKFCVIEEDVTIGMKCLIGHHVVIRRGTSIGDGVRIDDHATLGKVPMRASNTALSAKEPTPGACVGNGCLIGTSAVLYAGCVLDEYVLVADLATLRESVTIGAHTIIGRGVAVENSCTIGRYVKLETNAYVTAYSVIEDRAFVAPGVLTSNDNFAGRTEERKKHYKGVHVRRGGRIGVGTVILPGREIGADALVAGGAVVTRDAPPEAIFAGAPARAVRRVPENQLLKNQGWKDVDETDSEAA